MKIDMIKIIQDALIGGKNGHIAFIYHNQFIRDIFDSFEFNDKDKHDTENYEDAKFRQFLNAILKDK